MKSRVSLMLETTQVEELDTLVVTGKYANRSHAVRVAVHDLLKKEAAEK
jgi:Arc/MetJ-type ribon-helix-helix transcriptional regulator